jgi:hypothetical protein
MSYLSTPQPDEPQPPGTTPNKPKDPDVYGGQWGGPGGAKPAKEPPDRPQKIKPPAEDEGNRTPDTPPADDHP